jgi:hypothetical protein
VERHAADPGDQPVRQDGGETPGERRVAALLAPAAHHIVAGVDQREQAGDVRRVVLEVGVEEDEHAAARVIDPGRDSRGLAEVAPELDDLHPLVLGRELRELGEAPVRAAVVHVDDLERAAERLERADQPLMKRGQIPRLVVHRDDDRELERAPVDRAIGRRAV